MAHETLKLKDLGQGASYLHLYFLSTGYLSISIIFDLLDRNSQITQLIIINRAVMLQFNPTALITPFAKKKKYHTHTWFFSKLSATMETENHIGKKMLQCFSHCTVCSSRDFGKASSHDLRAIQYILWDN